MDGKCGTYGEGGDAYKVLVGKVWGVETTFKTQP